MIRQGALYYIQALCHPVLAVSATPFNRLTGTCIRLPVYDRAEAHLTGFAVPLTGIKTAGFIVCCCPCWDSHTGHYQYIEDIPPAILADVLHRLIPVFEFMDEKS